MRWQWLRLHERMARITELEKLLQTATSGEPDGIALRTVLREVVAALAPPRSMTCCTSRTDSMDTKTSDLTHLRACALAQKRLLDIVLRVLEVWSERWMCEQIQPMLFHLRYVVDQMRQKRGTSDVDAEEQWAQLKDVLCRDALDGHIWAPRERRAYTKRTTKASVSGAIGYAIKSCFACAGKELMTGAEILATIQVEPTIWSQVSEKLNRSPNEHQTRKQSEVWMANVRGNLGRFCEATTEKRDGKWLWRLKGARVLSSCALTLTVTSTRACNTYESGLAVIGPNRHLCKSVTCGSQF